MIPTAFGLGLVVSLAFSELLGVAAGGFFVPAYLALSAGDPRRALGLLAAGAATFAVMRLLARITILYSRRQLVVIGVVGIAFAHLVFLAEGVAGLPDTVSFRAVGYAVPGLVAFWMERQGAWATLFSAAAAAALIRLVLLATNGGGPIAVPV